MPRSGNIFSLMENWPFSKELTGAGQLLGTVFYLDTGAIEF